MNLGIIFCTGFSLGLSGAMIPGPLTLFAVSEILKTNKLAVCKILLGHILVEGLLVVLIVQGSHRFLANTNFLSIISVIGGFALIAMGILLFVQVKSMTISHLQPQGQFSRGLILGGIFFSIASPGFLLWWATIGLSSIVKTFLVGFTGLGALMLGHWLADVSWYGLLSYMLDKGKIYLSDAVYQNVIRFFAIVLVILGCLFLIPKQYTSTGSAQGSRSVLHKVSI